MNLSRKQHKAISFILFLSLLVLLHLGSGEVQPWDEGLYAVRAKSIIQYHDCWDQTQHALGGLYSSTPPPLSVWAMSASMSVFGEDAFAIRLFAALCSVISLLMIYLIARRMVSYEQSLMAVFLLSASLHWNNFARTGMTDVPLVMFFLIAFWAVIKVRESLTTKDSVIYSAAFALAFGAALMTKITISFLPLLFVLMLFFEKGNKKYFLAAASLAGIGLACPWYLYMALHHGSAFTNALFAPHIYSVVETNTQHLGPFYYLNQMLISNAFVLLSFIMMIMYFFKNIRVKIISYEFEKYKDNYLLKTSVVWFGLAFIVFSFAMTKMLHYSLYMMPPAVLLAVMFYENIQDIIRNNRIILLIFSAVALIIVWSFAFSIRQDVKFLFTDAKITINSIIFIVLVIGTLLTTFLVKKDFLDKKLFSFLYRFIYAMIIVLLLRIVISNMYINTGHSYGARHVADKLEEKNAKSFVYLYHEYTKADSLNPQLAWYTKGMMTHWYKYKTYRPVKLAPETFNLSEVSGINLYPDDYVVYYLPNDRMLAEIIIDKIQLIRPVIEVSQRYVLFGKQLSELNVLGKQM